MDQSKRTEQYLFTLSPASANAGLGLARLRERGLRSLARARQAGRQRDSDSGASEAGSLCLRKRQAPLRESRVAGVAVHDTDAQRPRRINV